MENSELFYRRIQRERAARKQAEAILEQKALELYRANEQLLHLNESLEQQVRDKLAEVERANAVADEARQAEKQFLANISHEIRTPLNAIIGMSHLLFDTQPTQQQREYLDILNTSANFLHSLISDLLDMTKIEAGRLEVNARPFDLAGLLRATQRVFEMKLQNRPVQIEVMIDARITGDFIGDEVMLNQILTNLVGNAEKFTETGHIQIAARIRYENGAKHWLEFSVSDTGIGIPEEKLGLVFQKFRQVNPAGHKYKGTGLGLAITKELVEIQGGTISVKSTVGKGSVFTFLLPFGKAPRSVSRPLGNVEQIAATGKGLDISHVLLVEDNSTNQKYIGSLLKKWGVAFTLAFDGRQAVDEARKQSFDLILMDIQMPILDGYEATAAIRSTHNPNQDTPIIALTASAMLDHKSVAFKAGMNDFLTKPFEPSQLLTVLQRYKRRETTAHQPLVSLELDQQRLSELYGSDLDAFAEMLDVFLTEIVHDFTGLLPLVHEQRWTDLARLVHKLKPTLGMVGLSDLEKKMADLEDFVNKTPVQPLIEVYCQEIVEDINHRLPLLRSEYHRLSNA